jgi:endonuclease/exonuclease/phosphatase family metal-dependent hydrolase
MACSPSVAAVIKVIQFNLQRCHTFDAAGNQTGSSVSDASSVIGHFTPDLVSLNEIEENQATQIGQALGMNVYFGRYESSSATGVAILSRTAILSSTHHRVPNYTPDTFLCLEISTKIDQQTVHFFSTHPRFNDNAVKPVQMIAMMNLLSVNTGCRILSGDFNDMDDRPNSYSRLGYINLLTGGSHGSILPSIPKLYDLQRKCGDETQTKNNPPYFGPASDWNAPYNSANTISQWAPRVRIDHIFVSPEFYLADIRNHCRAIDTMSLLQQLDPSGTARYIGDHRPLYAEITLPKPAIQLTLYPNFPLLVLPLGESYDLKVGGVDTDGSVVSLFTTDVAQPAGDPTRTGHLKPLVSWSATGEVVSLERLNEPVSYDPYLKYDRPFYNTIRVHADALGKATITASTSMASRAIEVKVIPRGSVYEYNEDQAKTVTVAPSGADFKSVKAAVDSFNTGGSNFNGTAPKTILITKSAVYLETASLQLKADGEWNIRCSATAGAATLVIPSPNNVNQGLIEAGDGIAPYDDGLAGSVHLENLIILPAQVAGSGIRSVNCKGIIADNNSTGMLSLSLKNVLISANNGSNTPASDGSYAANPNYTMIQSDGLRMLSGVDSLSVERTTITHVGGAGVNDNGDIIGPPDTERVIGAGCRFSYNLGNGYTVSGGDLTRIDGKRDSPVWFDHNQGSGLRFNSSINHIGNVAYAYFVSNGDPANVTSASGLHLVGTMPLDGAVFRKCIFAFNGSGPTAENVLWGNLSINNSQNGTFTFSDCTLIDAKADHSALALCNNTAGDTHLSFRDCIFAGGGGGGSDDILYTAEEGGSIVLDHCALVTSGENALDTARADDSTNGITKVGSGPGFTMNGIVHQDPEFASLDSSTQSFLSIRAQSYLGASSTGGILTGAGEYLGQSSTQSWHLYSRLNENIVR